MTRIGTNAPSKAGFDLAVRREDGPFQHVHELWPGKARTSDPDFAEFLVDLSESARGGETELRFPPHAAPALEPPGRWNIEGDERFAQEYPLSWNYLDERSPNFALKQLEKRIYLERLERWLDELPTGAQVLDLGGGIGRFAVEWLRRGLAVSLADPNAGALVLALGHLARAGGRFDLWHCAAESLAPMPDESFWAISAMEVFCYLSVPAMGMREAARVLRPGGILMLSVESPIGSLDPGVPHSRDELERALEQESRSAEGDVWVHYFTPESLRRTLVEAGFEVEAIMGTHYLPDGPMHHLVDFDRLGDPDYERALISLEHLLEGSSRWTHAARAWVAVARKP